MLFKKLQKIKNHIESANKEMQHEQCHTYQCSIPEHIQQSSESLDPDLDVFPTESIIVGMDYPESDNDVVNNEFQENTSGAVKSQGEESIEDDSNTECEYERVFKFIDKYADLKNKDVQAMRDDLITVLSDIKHIKKFGLENTQWAIDFVDALNELSVAF